MEFKRKLGTVDAHNVNLNFTPDNTDSHDIILNFEHLATGSTNLNFGDDVTAEIDTLLDADFNFEVGAVYADSGANTSTIDTVLDAEFQYSVHAVFLESTDVIAQIDYVLDAQLSFDVQAVFAENYCVVDMSVDVPNIKAQAIFDINHIVGVTSGFSARFKKTIGLMQKHKIPWSKAVSRAHLSAFFVVDADPILSTADFKHEQGVVLQRSIQAIHEVTTGLSSDFSFAFEDNLRIKINRSTVFEQAKKLSKDVEFVWQELIRKRKQFTYNHEVAKLIEKTFTFKWDKSLEIRTTNEIRWDQAEAIHYIKHPVVPWPKPPIPEYVGSTDLNFNCLCTGVDAHNVILNFGVDDCLPKIPERKWWYILNRLKVSRLDNGEEIIVKNGNYSADRSTWCWSHSLVVPSSQLPKLEPIDGQPVILKIEVNGGEHHMLLERRSRNRVFAMDDWTLTGRSVTALLDTPYAASRSFLQENERTAYQLCQAELDRVWNDAELDWQLYDPMSWIVPNNSFTYSNLSPIAAIKQLVESAGGFVSSTKAGNKLTIKPMYKKTFMDAWQIEDFDKTIPHGLVKSQSTDYEMLPDYNKAYLVSEITGKPFEVERAGTGGNIPLPMETSRLFTFESATTKGKALLAKAGLIEYHSLVLPIHDAVGECEPGELITFDDWWGTVDAVRVDYSHSMVLQTVKVERANRE